MTYRYVMDRPTLLNSIRHWLHKAANGRPRHWPHWRPWMGPDDTNTVCDVCGGHPGVSRIRIHS